MSDNVELTNEEWENLKRAYKKAKEEGKDMFIFCGHTFITEYVKYLIEYNEGK